MDNKRGFTIIELVVAIAIIAALYSFAMPRYLQLQHQARIAKATSLYNVIHAAATISKAICLAEKVSQKTKSCADGSGYIMYNGITVHMQNEYPEASIGDNGIINASQITESKDSVSISSTGSGIYKVVNIDVDGSTPGTCRISYSAPTKKGDDLKMYINISGC